MKKKKIFVLIGKSASGKDTLFNKLKDSLYFDPVISDTTRPMRPGERDGVEYNFISNDKFISGINDGKYVEYRKYHTVDGLWYYGVKVDSLHLDNVYPMIVIMDFDGYRDLKSALAGKEVEIIGIYLQADETLRKKRAIKRQLGCFDEGEWNRRAKDDDEKFSMDIAEKEGCLLLNNNTGFDIIVNTIILIGLC